MVDPTSPFRILVVDDSPENLRLLFKILTQHGYRVRVANNGSRAIQAALAHPPDLILLDIAMPEPDGFETCAQLKAAERTRQIPIIFLSARGTIDDKLNAFRVGGVDYIQKPFQPAEVVARISTHLNLQAMRRQLQAQNAQLEQEIVERRQAEAQLQHFTARLQLLHELDQALLTTTSPEAIATAALGRVRQLLPCQRASVVELTNPQRPRVLAIEAGAGWTLNVAVWEQTLPGEPEQLCRLQNVPDLGALAERSALQEALYAAGTRACLMIPLPFQGQVIGALNLESDQPNAFTAEHLNIAVEIAVLLAVAIWQAQLYAALQHELLERRAAEAALRQSEAALREYAAGLEASNAELDAFAHTVAHDLKGPLTALIGFSDLLQSRRARMAEEQIQQALLTISQMGRKMTGIINALLLLASVRKMTEVNLVPLDMGAIVAEVQNRLSAALSESGAVLSLPASWPTAVGYSPWIEEVWTNYISNAIKYGGLPPRIELGWDEMQGTGEAFDQVRPFWRFWVRDNGAGLSSGQSAFLFTEFTRLDYARAEGHGLGLSIVKRIVEKLGGQVGVESPVGEGSTFWFTLPAHLRH